MGLPPPNYKKDSLLAEPAEKKTVLPVQGGGFLRSQHGGADTVYKGLVNAGIDCYINSAIQFLYSVVPFRNILLKSTAATLNPIAAADKDTEAETTRKRDGILALKHIFTEYEKATDKIDIRKLSDPVNAFDPILLLGGVNDKGEPRMDPFRQQDSQELIGHIFDTLKKFIISTELETFEHVYRRSILCKEGDVKELAKPVSSSIIILPMKGKSIQEIFTIAQNPIILDTTKKNNEIDACITTSNPDGIGISETNIYDVSKTEYLTFLLQRYTSDGKKINDSIKINKIIKIGERNYEIIGSILHMGGTGGGHYMYNVYDEGSLTITLNDEKKTEFSNKSDGPFVEGDVSTLGYIFLYKYTDKEAEAEAQVVEEEPQEPAEPTEPTIKLTVGFRVRNPDTAKDKIRELSFTQGEELLFKRLGFDKPFIRKYITLPDATKEESDASKDAFFKFWKMYVLMDGTSQFSLMTKGESQKVQQYMRDILDAYRKYLSESALQLLFHTSGKPYEPTLEDSSTDPFVFTKQGTPAKSQDHTKVSKAVKELIEAVAAAKEIDFKGHRISIAKTTTLTTAKASYEGLKIDIAKLIEQGKKAIAAGVVASLDTGETLTAITAIEGFTFTPGEDLEDVIKAANDLISLATNLIKKLEALEKAAREFAVIVEVEVEVEGEGDSNDESYEPSENGDEGSEDEEEEDDNSNADSNAGTVNTLETVRPRGPSNPIMIELKRLLLSIDKIVSKRVDDNKTISDIIVALSNALPEDDFGAKLRIFMGNPRKQEGIHIDVGSSKIAPTTFFNLYLIEKGKNVLEPNKRFTSIIHNLIKLDLRRLSEPVKAQLVQISKNKILLRDITKHRSRLLDFMDKRVT